MRAHAYERKLLRSASTFTSQRKKKRSNIISRTNSVKLTFTNPYFYRTLHETKKSLFNLRQRVTFVLRAGVEPAQVSLSVFETDASTDSAIGANHTEKNSNRKIVLASLNLILLQR